MIDSIAKGLLFHRFVASIYSVLNTQQGED